MFDDRRSRRIVMAERGQPNFSISRVPGHTEAALAGEHFAESLALLENPNLYPSFVAKWGDISIPDLTGKPRFFATDPNALFRAHEGEEIDWTRIYQITMPS